MAGSVERILTRHFLRRFLENDLISPDADRLQLLAVVGAGLFSCTLFVSAFMSFEYLGIPTAGPVAVAALDDRYFYIALSMVVVALVAVAQWDALVVDARDASILEPLPVSAVVVRRAKLAAVAVLGGAAALALNLVPTIMFPSLLVYHLNVGFLAVFGLMATHLAITVSAAACAYLGVIALREGLAAVLPGRLFATVSPWIQGALIVLLGTALLMVPAASRDVARRGLEGARAMAPPAWFLGAYETIAGGIVADSPRGRMTPRQARLDAGFTAVYEQQRGRFPALARRAASALGIVILIAGASLAWTAGRSTALAPPPAAPVRRRWRLARRLAALTIVRDPTMRAGFFFALSALWRSSVHRLTIACAAAVGVAAALIALSRVSVVPVTAPEALPARLLVVQPLLFGILLVAFRHAIRVPAELRANWGFQLAWNEQERRFVAGVTRAAIVSLVLPVLLALLPLYAYVMGPSLALAHAALGCAGAVVFLEALLVAYDKVPFTCTYLPDENMKALAPLYVVAFLLGASLFARMQRGALQDGGAAIQLLALLAAAYVLLRVASARMRRPELVDFNEAPATTQRLGLHT